MPVFLFKHLLLMPKHTKHFLIKYGIFILLLPFAIALYAKFHPAKPAYQYHVKIAERYYIYDNAGRLIGSCEYGNSGIDSIILKDNE